jgi:16S rRNA (cytidine1402-2'-O)-methyltransferase
VSGKLILIPTGLDDALPLEPVALQLLKDHALDAQYVFLVEDAKVARRRWIAWGLPRETIDRFELYNEHNQEKNIASCIQQLQSGKTVVLMSDSGLPAFCDPGQRLVEQCHRHGVQVTATPFPNSIALAVALSGFPHHEFYFAGFLPVESSDRKRKLADLAKFRCPIVLMDTPYRLQSLLKDVAVSALSDRELFLAVNLNQPDEVCYRGPITGKNSVMFKIGELNKVEFVMMIA